MSARMIAFGAYDIRKPRVRLLLEAIRRAGALSGEIRIGGWDRVAQTNIPSLLAVIGVLVRMALAYPGALLRLWRSERNADILLPYPGIVEILFLTGLARLTGRKLVLDAFLPLHDTIVKDRGLVKSDGVAARVIWRFERAALTRADLVIVDTDAHGDYFAREFGIARDRFVTVLVGAEEQFRTAGANGDRAQDILGPPDERAIVLFYGQLIPLHGLPTILAAASEYDGPGARWIMIGRGQLEPLVRKAMSGRTANGQPIEWIPWVDYERLPAVIGRASVCLGVFGSSDKASRVIPNKVFQQLAMGKPVITRESPAMSPLAERFPHAIRTVPASDPAALAEAVAEALKKSESRAIDGEELRDQLGPDAGVSRLLRRLEMAV